MKVEKPGIVPRVVKLLLAIPSAAAGFLMLTWVYLFDPASEVAIGFRIFSWFVLILGTAFLLNSFLLWKRKKFLNVQLSAGVLAAFFLLFEFFCLGFGIPASAGKVEDFDVFNQTCITYDSISGFRFTRGARIARVTNGELEFDNHFRVNKRGMVTSQEFVAKKTDSTGKRYIVFGNSFTAAMFLQVPWPDQVQRRLDSAGKKIELYSFGIDGGGIKNWHRIYFREILPDYQFDGIIFSIYGDNLAREFLIHHHEDTVNSFVRYFPKAPDNSIDFLNNFLPKMDLIREVRSDEWIDTRLAILKEKPWTGSRLLTLMGKRLAPYQPTLLDFAIRFNQTWFSPAGDVSIDEIMNRYGIEKIGLLSEIVSSARQKGADVIFASIPGLPGIYTHQSGKQTVTQADIEFLSSLWNVPFFDGFDVFFTFDEQKLASCFFEYDGHWTQEGSDWFAASFSEFLARR